MFGNGSILVTSNVAIGTGTHGIVEVVANVARRIVAFAKLMHFFAFYP